MSLIDYPAINSNHDLAQIRCRDCGADVPATDYAGRDCWCCRHPLDAPWHHAEADRMNRRGLELFEAEARATLARYPSDSEPDEAARGVALRALADYILDRTTIDAAGEARLTTQVAAARASIAAQTIARLEVLDGMPEAEAARRAGLDRMTVRKMLGKR